MRLQRSGESTATETKTEDVSCEGFFFITNRKLSPQETLVCELVIPGEDSDWPAEHGIVLRCRAEVVRVVARADESYGVACRVADYTVAHSATEESTRDAIGLPALAVSVA